MLHSKISRLLMALLLCASCNSSPTQTENKGSLDSLPPKNDNSSQVFNLDTSKLTSGTLFYQCEMHPEVLSDMPGNCPKCGMVLSELKKQ